MRSVILATLLGLATVVLTVSAAPIAQALAAQVLESHTGATEDLVVDVTRAFVSGGDEVVMQVALSVQVVSGTISVNNAPASVGMLTQLRVAASLTTTNKATQEILNVRPVSVLVRVFVASSFNAVTNTRTLQVQEAVTEVDGTTITQIDVQEVAIDVDANGQEIHRVISHLELAQSVLTPATTTTTTTAASTANTLLEGSNTPSTEMIGLDPLADTNGNSPSDSDSDSDSNSPSDSDADMDGMASNSTDGHHHHHRHHFLGSVACWFHKQSLAVRIVLTAVGAILACLVLNVLFCILTTCCCPPKPKSSRQVYLNNVKLHYAPLNTEDDSPKKVIMA